MPPSREWRVLDSITLLNNHLLQSGFSNWKIYKQKCLEIRTYYEQISKRKTYLFWKHYSMKRRTLRLKEEELMTARKDYHLKKCWLSLKKFAANRRILLKKQRAIKFEHERRVRVYYFSFWNKLAMSLDRERGLDNLSTNCHKETLVWKAFKGLKKVVEQRISKLAKKHKVTSYLTSKVLFNIFFGWKVWSSKRALLKLKQRKLSNKKTKETLKVHFSNWRVEQKANIKVNSFRWMLLKRRGMEGFIKYYLNQKSNEEIADNYRAEQEQKQFQNIFAEFVSTTIKRSTYKKVLLFNQERRFVELMNMAFASLYAHMINKSKIKRRLAEYNQIKAKRTKRRVLEYWSTFIQKTYQLHHLYSQFKAMKDADRKVKFLNTWLNQYRTSVEDREHEEHYIEQSNSKTKLAVFSFLKKLYEKTNQKAVISADFFTLTTLSKCFHALDEYLYVKKHERRQLTQFRRKYDVVFMKKILAAFRVVTVNNESKRKLRNRALNHCLSSRISKIFTELRNFAVQSSKDKKVVKRLKQRTSSNFFERWREEYKLSIARRTMNKKLYLRSGIAFFDYIRYKQAQDKRVGEFKKKIYLKTTGYFFGELFNYLLLGRKKKNLLTLAKKIELSRKSRLLESWKEEYMKAQNFNIVARNFAEMREEKIKRLFMDLLMIKKQKKILRSMLLEKFKATTREIYLRKFFMQFAEAVFTIKTMHKAQEDYTVKKEHSLMHRYFDHMKEFLSTQRQLSERAVSHSQRSSTNRKHEIVDSWREYAQRKREEKYKSQRIQKNSQRRALAKYFEM